MHFISPVYLCTEHFFWKKSAKEWRRGAWKAPARGGDSYCYKYATGFLPAFLTGYHVRITGEGSPRTEFEEVTAYKQRLGTKACEGVSPPGPLNGTEHSQADS